MVLTHGLFGQKVDSDVQQEDQDESHIKASFRGQLMDFVGAQKHVVVGADKVARDNQSLPRFEPLAGLADYEVLLHELFVLGELYFSIKQLAINL